MITIINNYNNYKHLWWFTCFTCEDGVRPTLTELLPQSVSAEGANGNAFLDVPDTFPLILKCQFSKEKRALSFAKVSQFCLQDLR